jgi:hypothetical protein
MKPPRPSRTARWVIGFAWTSVLALAAVCFGIVALVGGAVEAIDTTGPNDGGALVQASATVLDVDAYDFYDHPIGKGSDWAADDGYATVDIDFMVAGEHEVTVLDWPNDGSRLPSEGDALDIMYDATDPEYRPTLVNDTTEVPADPVDPLAGQAVDAPNWPGPVAAVLGVLAMVSLVATVIWAQRAAPASAGSPPPLGWNGPSQNWTQPPPSWNPATQSWTQPPITQPPPSWNPATQSWTQPSTTQPPPAWNPGTQSWTQPPSSPPPPPPNDLVPPG